jgi:hypothetical protein
MVYGIRFRVSGSGFMDQGSEVRVQGIGLGFRVYGSGFRVYGSELRIQGLEFMV